MKTLILSVCFCTTCGLVDNKECRRFLPNLHAGPLSSVEDCHTPIKLALYQADEKEGSLILPVL